MLFCPQCGTPAPEGAAVCPRCGAPAPEAGDPAPGPSAAGGVARSAAASYSVAGARTVIGVARTDALPTAAAPVPSSRTMIGMPAELAAPPPGAAATPAPPPNRTILGVA